MLKGIQREVIREARQKVIASFDTYYVPEPYRECIIEAFDEGLAGKWDIMAMDGCTLVSDYWPTKWSPSCTPHDFHYITGRGGWLSDRIFTEINKCYALPPHVVTKRHIGGTVAWWAWFKWKHLFKGNVKPYTPAMLKALDYYRKNGKLEPYKN